MFPDGLQHMVLVDFAHEQRIGDLDGQVRVSGEGAGRIYYAPRGKYASVSAAPVRFGDVRRP
jgi:hypothetical protein